MNRWMLMVTIYLCLGSTAQLHAGAVAHPALGSFRTGEGTIEVWLTPVAELRPELEPGQFVGAFRIFELGVPGLDFMALKHSMR